MERGSLEHNETAENTTFGTQMNADKDEFHHEGTKDTKKTSRCLNCLNYLNRLNKSFSP